MKQNSGKNRKGLMAVVAALGIVLAALVGIAVYLHLQQDSVDTHAGGLPVQSETPPNTTETTTPNTTPADTTPPHTTIPTATEPEQTDIIIVTPYCRLYYPQTWKEDVIVRTQEKEYGCIVTLLGTAGGKEVELFSLYFAETGEASYPVGVLTFAGTSMDVSLALKDLHGITDPDDAHKLSAMQEDVNYLLDKLEQNPDFTSLTQSPTPPPNPVAPTTPANTQPATTPPAETDLVLKTPYCDLYYPAQWKDVVRAEGNPTEYGYVATFFGSVNGKEQRLFTIYLAEEGEGSIPAGILESDGMFMDVNVSMPSLPEDSNWSTSEQDLFYTLQEQVNHMLQKLKDDGVFTPVDG